MVFEEYDCFLVLANTTSSLYFSPNCQNSTHIGHKCNTFGTICALLRPCKNGGRCNNTKNNIDYNCSCEPGFHGPKCEYDHRSCDDTACSYHGAVFSSTFVQH